MPRSKTISALLVLLQCVALGVALHAGVAGARPLSNAAGLAAFEDCASIASGSKGDHGKCGENHCCILCSSSSYDTQADYRAILNKDVAIAPQRECIADAQMDREQFCRDAGGWTSSWSSRGPPSFS